MNFSANRNRAAPLLAIETAGSRCSAAVTDGEAVLAAESRLLRHGHAEALLPMIDRVMIAAGLRPAQLAAVAAATGPGGFTGIRVGLAAAHGIALATGARLVGVTSFAAVAAAAAAPGGDSEAALLVALDSRRAELYVQLFAPATMASRALAEPQALLPEMLADYVAAAHRDAAGVRIAGDAGAVAAAALSGLPHRLSLVADSAPDARGVARAALRLIAAGAAPAPLPLYLRPPDVTLAPLGPQPGPPATAR
ncbi:MAG: tRNA (adenosine(37)-N6)-threonylcarbamoyltransferase complex dimerization subunit type 1 TsaB [Thiohalocapsa sp.]